MSTGPRTVWDDAVLPFQLDGLDVRGRTARLGETLDSILAIPYDRRSPGFGGVPARSINGSKSNEVNSCRGLAVRGRSP